MDGDRERELAAAERDAYHEAATDVFEPRRRSHRFVGPLLALILAAVVLAASAAAGWGLAQLVARVASVPPPAVTVSPQPAATPTPLPSPSVSASPASPSPSTEPTESAIPSQAIHVVQPGEFLSQIALRYGVTTEAIAEANGIENPDLIEAGQRLIIPPRP